MKRLAKAVVLTGTTWLACVAGCEPDPSTIGGTEVPSGLHCEEDEAIQFVGVDELGCIHVDFLDDPWNRP